MFFFSCFTSSIAFLTQNLSKCKPVYILFKIYTAAMLCYAESINGYFLVLPNVDLKLLLTDAKRQKKGMSGSGKSVRIRKFSTAIFVTNVVQEKETKIKPKIAVEHD